MTILTKFSCLNCPTKIHALNLMHLLIRNDSLIFPPKGGTRQRKWEMPYYVCSVDQICHMIILMRYN